jgi:hypothetical protein
MKLRVQMLQALVFRHKPTASVGGLFHLPSVDLTLAGRLRPTGLLYGGGICRVSLSRSSLSFVLAKGANAVF